MLSSILWTAALSHALHTVVIYLQPDYELLERRYLVLTYGFPIIALVLPIVGSDYGAAEGWCWIASHGWGPTIMRFLCYYAPLVIVIFYNILQYRRVIKEINENALEEVNVSKRLKFYPLVLIITQISLTVHRLIYFFAGVSYMPLAIIGVLTTSLMGMINAFLYGFTEPVKNHVVN